MNDPVISYIGSFFRSQARMSAKSLHRKWPSTLREGGYASANDSFGVFIPVRLGNQLLRHYGATKE
jgi:hypothetical protein